MQMATTYRYLVKVNGFAGLGRDPNALNAYRVLEARRSNRVQASFLSEFVKALESHEPFSGATAYAELSDARGYVRNLARYSYYRPGQWILDDGEEGLPDFVVSSNVQR
jgi:hypothetical protein